MGLLAGALGWVVTDVSCEETCTGWSILWAVVAFLGVTVGVALVLVLVYRSLAEWRDKSSPVRPD
jgi:nitrogen fixation protein FixH